MIIFQPQEDSAMNNDKVEKSPSMVIKYLVFSYCAHQGAKYTKKNCQRTYDYLSLDKWKVKKKKNYQEKVTFCPLLKNLNIYNT